MKTDALYLNLFEVSPSLALHLAGYDIARASEYTCHSEELKKTFRVDAVLTPPPESDLPLVLAEVQFQKESGIYARLVASCAIMLVQSPEYREVRMVIFFANRSVDAGAGMWQPLVDAGTLQVVYLDEATELLLKEQSFSPLERASLLLARVTVSPYNRERDDAVALEFGRTLVPIEDKRSLQEFKNFFIRKRTKINGCFDKLSMRYDAPLSLSLSKATSFTYFSSIPKFVLGQIQHLNVRGGTRDDSQHRNL